MFCLTNLAVVRDTCFCCSFCCCLDRFCKTKQNDKVQLSIVNSKIPCGSKNHRSPPPPLSSRRRVSRLCVRVFSFMSGCTKQHKMKTQGPQLWHFGKHPEQNNAHRKACLLNWSDCKEHRSLQHTSISPKQHIRFSSRWPQIHSSVWDASCTGGRGWDSEA